MKFRVAPALALLLPMVALADSPPKPSMQLKLKSYSLNMRDYSFPSGLRIVFQQDNSQPIVNVSSVIDHGSSDEPEGLEGMAHLIEHLNFRAVHKDGQGKDLPPIMDIVKQLGGAAFNATTANDRTNYLTTVPKENLIPLLRIESLRLRNTVEGVTDDVIKTEREVVRNELRSNMENGVEAGIQYLYASLYPKGHPYSRLTIGTHDSLDNITLKDVQAFCAKYYRPSETTILVSGDFSLDDTSKYLGEFGIDQLAAPDDPKGEHISMVEPKIRVSGASAEPPDPPKPVEVKGEVLPLTEVQNLVEKPTVLVAWSVPGGWRPTQPMMELAAWQLGIAMTQEMNPDWVYTSDDSSKRTDVGCWLDANKVASTVVCYFELADKKDAQKKVETALNGIHNIYSTDEYFRQFQNYLYSYAKFSQMRNLFMSVDSLSDVFGRGEQVSEFIHQTGDVQFYSRNFEWLNKVNADDARKFAEKYLKRERAAAVLVVPYEEGKSDVESKSAAYAGTRREDQANSIFTDSELSADNVAKAVRTPDLSKLQESTLPNGMKLVVYKHGEAPLVESRLYFNGGPLSKGVDRKALTFAGNLWREDSPVDPLQIAGDAFYTFENTDSVEVVQASAGNIPDALYIARNRLDKLIPYTDGKLDWAKAEKRGILTWMKDPDSWASQVQRERLYPDNAEMKYLTHKDFDDMTKWSVSVGQNAFSTMFRPENATLYIVGGIDPAEATKAAQTYFGGWTGWGKKPDDWTRPSLESNPPGPTLPDRQVILFNRDSQTQAHVVLGCQMAPVTLDNYQTQHVMSSYVSQILWLALREQTGASYGAYGFLQSFPGGMNTFVEYVDTLQNNKLGLALRSFFDPMEKLKAGKIDTRMWNVERMNLALTTVSRQVTGEQMLGRLRQYEYWGWGYKAFDTEAKRISTADANTVPPMLDKCVNHEVVTVVGPVDVYKPLLDAEGIKYEVFDWKKTTNDYRVSMGLKPEEDKKDDDKKDDKKK